jgi:hypothetical protein
LAAVNPIAVAADSAGVQVFYMKKAARARWVVFAVICFCGGLAGLVADERILPILVLTTAFYCFAKCFQKLVFENGSMTYSRSPISTQTLKLANVTRVRYRKMPASAGWERGRWSLGFMKGDKVLCSFPLKDFGREALVATVEQIRQHSGLEIEKEPGAQLWF